MCRDLVKPCKGKAGSIGCQVMVHAGKLEDGHSIGQQKKMTLTYADGKVSMRHEGGDHCSSGFPRMTVINFVCNKTAGKGSPKFDSEEACVYVFTWQTDAVCNSIGSLRRLCTVTDGSRVFDLSRLTRNVKMSEENWKVIDTREGTDYSYYINVCDELVHSTTPACPDHVYACQLSKGGQVHKSLGNQMVLSINSDNTLKLNFSGGDVCSHSHTNRSALITLVCSPGSLVSSPEFVTELDDCTYEFVWYTAAACPVGTFVGHDCTLYDQVDGFVFNLTHLSSRAFHASTPFYTYDISVCSALKEGPCKDKPGAAVCRNTATPSVLGKTNNILEYKDGVLSLSLTGGDQCSITSEAQSTRINFVCDPHAKDNSIEVLDLGTKSKDCISSYNILWKTQYACHAKAMPCVATDGLNTYDLSELALIGSNWQAEDNRGGKDKDFRYFINVCRSLNPVHGCSPLAGACQTHRPNEKSNAKETGDFVANIGEPAAPVYNKQMKRLELNYTSTSGGLCHNKYHRKTHIVFLCDASVGLGSPKFIEETNECTYIFEWTTSAACPLKEIISKDFCRVTQNNYTYDLTPLMKNDSDYHSSSGGYDYSINVCRNLTEKCASKEVSQDTSVCQKSVGGSSSYSLGKRNTSVVMGDRSITVTYLHGTQCHDKTERKTVIEFICDRSDHNASLLKVGESSHCSYVFQMATPLVCQPSQVPCEATGPSGYYDLSPLTKLNGHWTVSSGDSNSHTFYINVCRSVDDTSGCRANTGTCQVTADKRTFNAGYVLSSPVVVGNGLLVLRYQNGDICHKKYPRSTTIKFSCGDEEGEPVFERETPYCEYIFTWQTKHACPRRMIMGHDCTVTESYHGEPVTFNFSRLSEKSHMVSVPGGSSLALQVCKPVTIACSGKHAGACLQTSNAPIDYGTVNSNVMYHDGELILNYTKGDKCQADKTRNYYTAVLFRCDRSDMKAIHGQGPNLLPKGDDCGLTIEWLTPLACPPQQEPVDCTVFDSDPKYMTMFDFSPLIRLNKPWTAVLPYPPRDESSQFYINVCAPLSTNYPGTRCDYSAGVCEVDYDEHGKIKSSSSLGRGNEGPYIQDHEVYIKYELGDSCKGKLGKKKAIIHFHCRYGSVGSPELSDVEDEDCIHRFNWFSETACPTNTRATTAPPIKGSHPTLPPGDCTATNPLTGHKYDLTALSTADKQATGVDGHKYALHVCGKLTNSNYLSHLKNQSAKGAIGAAQLASSNSYFSAGRYSKQLTVVKGNVLELVYSSGDVCHGKYERSTVITFVCNKTDGGPKFQYESEECAYNFQWKTPLACEREFECSTTYKGKSYDLSSLVGRGDGAQGNWEVSISQSGIVGTVYLQLCQAVDAVPKTKCPPNAGACLVSMTGGAQNLGEPTSGPEFHDGTLSLTYRNGDKNPNCKNPSAQMQAVINFVCKQSSMGRPQFVLFDKENCSFVFNWETSLVCTDSTPQQPVKASCDYTDQLTGTVYSLTSLQSVNDTMITQLGRTLSMNVCQKLRKPTAGCGQDSMVCSNGKNVGSLSSMKLYLDPLGLRLRMKLQGQSCGAGTYRTTIYFNCKRSAGKGKPVLENVDDCHYMISWDTSLACPPTPDHCVVISKKHSVFDLELLSRRTSSWPVLTNNHVGGMIDMNVCDAVVDLNAADEGCPTDAAVCHKISGKAYSLGSTASSHLSLSSDERVIQLIYANGYKCQYNPPLRAQTTIQFVCDEAAGKGKPILKLVTNKCKYNIMWKTAVACPMKKTKPNSMSSCTINTNIGQIDLSSLNTQDYSTVEERQIGSTVDSYVYHLRACGPLKDRFGCSNKAMVCQTKQQSTDFSPKTLGVGNEFQLTLLNNGDVEMKANGTSPCHHGNQNWHSMKQTLIQFTCSREEKGPVFVYESNQCHYVFDWETPAVCSEIPPTIPAPRNTVPSGDKKGGASGSNKEAGSNAGKVFGIIVLIMVIAAIILIVFILIKSPEKRYDIPRLVYISSISMYGIYFPLSVNHYF
jgi:insulin-like growth factor 2 receptor